MESLGIISMCLTFMCTFIFVDNVNAFNPFMDSELFMIKWAGPLKVLDQPLDDSNVVIMTKNEEKYQCILPESEEKRQENSKNYDGPTPDELMESLFIQDSCSYRIESYWTYELCHRKHLRQYHETKEPGKKSKVQEYYLGFKDPVSKQPSEKTDSKETTETTKEVKVKIPQKIKTKKIDGIELPYYEVNITEGTHCELLNAPRRARLLYVCQPDGRGEIFDMKESSTCEYEIMVLTNVLCSHPDFRPKNAPVNEIQCHSLENSPEKPKAISEFEYPTMSYTQHSAENREIDEQIIAQDGKTIEKVKIYRTPKATPAPTPTLGTNTDKQILREFLNGDYCLQGGTGWWKHEICYGKHARQYHDGPEGRQVIFLGQWNYNKHVHWLQSHPSKKPKERGSRKSISLYYSDGDACDLSGKHRSVEVRLKCVVNEQQPHAVALYLMEPSPCTYILGVESPLFCSLLDKADEDGIFDLDTIENL